MNDRQALLDDRIERARELARDVALGLVKPEALERARKALPPHQVECWKAFVETLTTLVRDQDFQRRAEWIDVLRGEIRTAIADPKKLFLSPNKHESRQFEAQVDGWKDELDPFVVWDSRSRGYLTLRGEYPFIHLHLLLCIEPTAWSVEVDALPALALMDGALDHYTHLNENPKLFEELLRISPRIFEENGQWVSSRSVVVLLLTHHVLSIDSSETWLRNAFRILLERPDGKYIAFAFLGYLAQKELIADQGHWGQRDEPEKMAFKILAELLGEKFSAKDAYDVWIAAEAVAKAKHEREKSRRVLKENDGVPRMAAERGEGARTLHGEGLPMLFGTAVMLGENPPQAEAETFWSWFEKLLIGRDKSLSGARYHSASPTVIPRIGALLACLPEPEKAFRAIYGKLESQRRRTMFSHHYEGHDDNVASMLLLDIGPYAALYWRKRDVNVEVKPLFWRCYEAARRLWLTALQRFSEDQRKLLCDFFAFIPHLFGDDIEKALETALAPIANDSWMVCSAGSLLLRNGIAPERLIQLMRSAGVDLEIALRDSYQWATLTKNQSIRRSLQTQNEEFPPAFEDLVRALGMALSIVELGENEPKLSQLERAFAMGIVWGSRLLQRLEDEHCTLRQLIPLDEKGAIWLLHVALPPNVPAQFGIAETIQLLVAHGDFGEHELRMAVLERTNNANVEPDLVVVASNQLGFAEKFAQLAGPWKRCVAWSIADDEYEYLSSALRRQLPKVVH